MRKSLHQLTNWAARAFSLAALMCCGGIGQQALAQDTDLSDGYYRITTASTTEIVGTALYNANGAMCWKTLDTDNVAFVWRVDATSDGYYRLTNPLIDISVGDDGKVQLIRQDNGSYAIKRPSAEGWIHALSHGNVSVDKGGTTTFGTVGWGFNTWYFEKMDDSDPLIQTAIDAKAASTKARTAIAENSTDLTPTVETESANNYADFFSNAGMTVEHGISFGNDGGGFKALIDGSTSTFFHTSWNGSPQWSDYQDDGTVVERANAVKADYAYETTNHNLGVKLTEASDNIYIQWMERIGQYSSTPTSINVEVSNDRENWTTVYTDYSNYSVSDAGGANVLIGPFKFDAPYQYVRISANSCYRRSDGRNNPVKYWNISGFKVYGLKDKLASATTEAVASLFASVYSTENSVSSSALKSATDGLDTEYNNVIETGGVVGISSAKTKAAGKAAPVYDLSGVRVTNPQKGGIYIQNGKKYVQE